MTKTTDKPSLTLVDPTTSSISPAQKFGPAGQTLWDGIMSEYGIADIGGLELLRQACAAQDRVASIRAAIDHAGEGISCARVGGRLEGDACSSKQPSAPPISLVAGPS